MACKPWALGYAANWGQIVGGAQYFGNLSPLRHLPEPTEGRSWWNGYGKKAFLGAKGEPIAQW